MAREKKFNAVPSRYYRVYNECLRQQGLPLKPALHQTYQSVRILGRGMTPVFVGQILNATWKSGPQNTNLSPISGQGSWKQLNNHGWYNVHGMDTQVHMETLIYLGFI